ncbi:MAG: DUF4838 domain-containing protein [Kiritimatiellae bacterium]|nr:DUF4838 domain-containing protein [Kiritimatiellia bacterium]
MQLTGMVLLAAVFTGGNAEVVVSPGASDVTHYAAREVATFLGRTLGVGLVPVEKPTPGRSHVYVGASEWATAAGVVTNGLARDAFRLKVTEKDVYIAGVDDPAVNVEKTLAQGIWRQHYARASIFGAYEFLERYVGTRFYFPGDLGTIVPHKEAVAAGETDETVAPAFTQRSYSYRESDWFEGSVRKARSKELWPRQFLHAMRLRMETEHVPCCHGLNRFCYLERFRDSHPEYFIMRNGKRFLDETVRHKGHICNTSAIWEEIYQDVKAYLSGRSAVTRGLPNGNDPRNNGWKWNCAQGKYVDIMCQDGLLPCECEGCRARYVAGIDWGKELIWSNTVAVANRLKAEGIPGYVTQMAYTGYRAVPDTVEIPDNVMVMVAEKGPWSVHQPHILKRNNDEIAAWHKKLGRQVWLWLYMNKFAALEIADVPTMTPKCVGEYFAAHKTDIFGAYIESECERFLYNHLNWYVFSRICWNRDVDVAAVLDEYYRLMYGPAAADVKRAFEIFEAKWVDEIGGRTIDTPIGPMGNPPADVPLFRKVYSPAVVAEVEKCFADAAAKCPRDSLEARRVALMWREIAEPLVARARAFHGLMEHAAPTGQAKVLEKDGDSVRFALGACEAGRKYRVTIDLKLENVTPNTSRAANGGSTAASGGVTLIVSDGVSGVAMHPYRNVYVDSFDWTRIAIDFTASKKIPKGRNAVVTVRLASASGKAWADNARLSDGL